MAARHLLAAASVGSVAIGAPAHALPLADCDRTTHPSHAGEAEHRDYGDGWIGHVEWWSQEGIYTDLVVSNCATGETLRTRVQEERIGPRGYYDRRDRAEALIDRHMSGAPAFFHLGVLAETLRHTGEDIVVFNSDIEFCACAALYPELRGDRKAFEGDD